MDAPIPHEADTPPPFRRKWLPGIALYCGAGILVQLLLTRLFSVTLGYHFAFMVISIVMLSLAAPGAVLYALPRRFPASRVAHQVAASALLFGLLLAAVTVLYLSLNLSPTSGADGWWLRAEGRRNLVIVFVLWMIPFLAGGFVPALLLSRYPDRAAAVYGWDLAGAAVGGAAYVGLLSFLSGITALLLAAAVLCACAWVFAGGHARRWSVAGAACAAVIAAGTIANATWPSPAPVRIRYTKTYAEPPPRIERWTPIARITVFEPGQPGMLRPDMGFGWGLSKKYHGPKPPELWIEQDASAGTPITGWDGRSTATVDHVMWDVTSMLHRVARPRDMYIVGCGGGRDVLAALLAGVPRVVAVDMNPATLDIVRNTLGAFTGGLYSDPRVELVCGEGRTTLRARGQKFDAIQVSLIDSLAATATGALVFAENILYTREGFETYLDHLRPAGVLTLSWWFIGDQSGVAYRMLAGARDALANRGVADPRRHLLGFHNDKLMTYLVKRDPWTPDELARARAEAERMGFLVLLDPERGSPVPELNEFLANPRAIEERFTVNVRAATDDAPFLFQLQKWGVPPEKVRPENRMFLAGTRILGPLLWLMAAAALVLVALPLAWRRLREGRAAGAARGGVPVVPAFLVATGCGFGYLVVEITLMHYGTLMVGYPVYALLLVLVALLLGSGAGSAWSARYAARRLAAAMGPVCAALALVIAAVGWQGHVVAAAGPTMPWAVRALLLGGASFALGFAMGLPFPTLMRVAGAGPGALLPWLWGVNGIAGVVSSVVVMIVAVFLGHQAAMLCAAGCYALVAAGFVWIAR